MALRLGKAAVVVWLGFVLAWQGFTAVPFGSGAMPVAGSGSCCRSSCDECAPACCGRPTQPASPYTPVPVRSSHNELQAIALPLANTLALYSPSAGEFSFGPSPSPVAAVPLFQRDCSYLI